MTSGLPLIAKQMKVGPCYAPSVHLIW